MSSAEFVVGYALNERKTRRFLKPTLVSLARGKGITFVAIDANRPLDEQGHFDVILHKLLGESWVQQLEAYQQRNPEVVILDPPNSIQKVNNRESMLQEVDSMSFSHPLGNVRAPKQIVVHCKRSIIIQDEVSKAGLKFPLVVKPLLVNDSAKAHALSLAFNAASLSELKPPVVLQEFVNHGGVLFKVFIVGHIVKVVRRHSLKDLPEDQSGTGITPFPRISRSTGNGDSEQIDPIISEPPPNDMLKSLSCELRRRLGLSLFNFDMIRKGGAGNDYYIVDINYFPGFGKLPEYEALFTEYLSSLAQSKQ